MFGNLVFKNFVVGLGAVLALVSVGMATNVQAKLSRVLGVDALVEQPVKPRLSVVDCTDGEKVLSTAGFTHVFATECSGAQYHFNGFRGGNEYTIVFNAQSSGFAVTSR